MVEKKVLGIDIGSEWIKLLELTETKEGKDIRHSITGFIRGKVEPGKPVFDMLRELIAQGDIKAREAIAVAQGQDVEVKFFDIKIKADKNYKKNLKNVIKYQLTKDNQMEIENYYLDNVVISEKDLQSGEKDLKIMVLLSKKDHVMQLFDSLDKSELVPIAIDCVPAALYNCLMYMKKLGTANEDNFAIVNLGLTGSVVSLVKGNMLCFVRELQTKGNDILDVIRNRFLIGSEEGSEAGGASRDELIMFTLDPKDKTEEFKDVIALKVEQLSRDIKNTIEFFEGQNEVEITKVFITGGVSRMYSLCDLLKEQIQGKELVILDPLQGISIDMEENQKNQLMSNPPQVAVALGLAARVY